MTEAGLSKQTIISQLSISPHGDLKQYIPVCGRAAMEDAEFYAHLISWNHAKGQIRDARVALPVLAWWSGAAEPRYVENAQAHVAMLSPKELLTALGFLGHLGGRTGDEALSQSRSVRRLVSRYLRAKERNYGAFERVALQHRGSLRRLYAFYHIKPGSDLINSILWGQDLGKPHRTIGYPAGSIFDRVARLHEMSNIEAAYYIRELKIPFLVNKGALGAKIKEPDVLLAVIETMTTSEITNNMKWLQSLNVNKVPALRAALEEKLSSGSKNKKNILKASVATGDIPGVRGGDDVIDDEILKIKVRAMQERQMKQMSIKGRWLVLGDRSPSMQASVEAARHVAGTLAKFVEDGKVFLVFFDALPWAFDVSGKSYEEILKMTANVQAGGGGTSIGCGLNYCLDTNIEVDGIAICSDAQENCAPLFVDVYKRYCAKVKNDTMIPVYLYRFAGTMRGVRDRDLAASMSAAGLDMQEFDLRGGVDYYSIANLITTMRVSRYSLVDEIMQCPILTLDQVLGVA